MRLTVGSGAINTRSVMQLQVSQRTRPVHLGEPGSRVRLRREPAWTLTHGNVELGNYTLVVGTVQERAAEERQAKLERIREQVLSGTLVIRQMTRRERLRWSKQRATLEATFTQAERSRRDSALRKRRQRTERLRGNAP